MADPTKEAAKKLAEDLALFGAEVQPPSEDVMRDLIAKQTRQLASDYAAAAPVKKQQFADDVASFEFE